MCVRVRAEMADWRTDLARSAREGLAHACEGLRGAVHAAAAPGGEAQCLPPPLDQLSSGGVAAAFTRASCAGAFTGGDMSHLAGMAVV